MSDIHDDQRSSRGRDYPRLAALLLAWLLAACGDATPTPFQSVHQTDSPAGAGSGQPSVFASSDGRVYLSWLEPAGEDEFALRYATWLDGGWTAARTVSRGRDWFVNSADFPSLVELPGGRLAAHWLDWGGPSPYAYEVRVAQSPDGGRSWSRPVTPHTDSTATEHGFVSMFPWEGDRLGLVWLDGREMVEEGGEMTLRFTWLGGKGELGPPVLLDERVCECCQTDAALTAAGPLVVYRGRSPEEVRDIHYLRYTGGRWSRPRPVHADGWVIAGCPVNGPAVAAEGKSVVVAWYTAARDTARVMVAFSDDAGATFSPPLRVDDGAPRGRVDALLTGDGSALVSWVENAGDHGELRVRRLVSGRASANRTGRPLASSATVATGASGFPRMARVGREVWIAWTEASSPTRVRVARARLGRLPGQP
ncbi:MAG: sialidase family protein [Longimicrobiaceae bacterium]